VHPEVSKARARVAALSRGVRAGERTHDDLNAAKRDLVAANLEQHVRRAVDAFPSLTREQIDRVAAILRGAPTYLPDRESVVRGRLAELDGGGESAY
jgi:hypothetical protein